MTTNMIYGSFSFDPQPIPLMSISKAFHKTSDGTPLGTTLSITLEGTIVKATGSAETAGIDDVMQEMDVIRDGFKNDGQTFFVTCDGTTIFSGNPRVTNITFSQSNDNWVYTAPYTIELEMHDELEGGYEGSGLAPPYIQDFSESWNLEFADNKSPFYWSLPSGAGLDDACPYQLRITHNISAVGQSVYTDGALVKPAWQQAQDYVRPRLGFDSTFLSMTGVWNLNTLGFGTYDHVRTNQIDIGGGNFAVTESWLVIDPTGLGVAGKATEDFNITVTKSTDTSLTTAVIEGTIQGLEERSYGTNSGDFSIDTYKYTNASGYWKVVKDKLYYRAKQVADSLAIRSINILPLNQSEGHSPCEGKITYTYGYNDRPSLCLGNTVSENIVISDENQADVFASLTILGRTAGPILQQLNTKTAAKRTLAVDVIVTPPSSCPDNFANYLAQRPTGIQNIVDSVYTDLTTTYNQVFVQQDTDSWEATLGRYQRTVVWTYQSC